MNIPLVNLAAQYRPFAKEVDRAIKNVTKKGDFILGTAVSQFEKEFARYIGVRYCVGVASGTDAIKIMAMAAGINKGDEVIIQANTFIATALPFIELGATPVFVDADPTTGAIDVYQVAKKVTKQTRAIVPVHLYGRPAPMAQLSKLARLARRYRILLLEDAAQAHGASVGGKKAGSFGDMAAFSFYPGKNLGAFGDAGAVVTNNKKFASSIRTIRNIGQKKKYEHIRLGLNSRLDTIQAAVLGVKLKHLDAWNRGRARVARQFMSGLTGVGDIILPLPTVGKLISNNHLFVIRTKKRDQLMKYLERNGIHSGIHYPVPLHLTPALKFLGYKKGDFPVAEARATSMISLPIYAELTQKEIDYIINTIKQFYETKR